MLEVINVFIAYLWKEQNFRKMTENTEKLSQQTPFIEQELTQQAKEDRLRSERIQLAKDILRGVHGEVDDMNGLYKDLKKYSKFGLARKILYILRKKQPNDLKIYQQEALCTYKDPDLPSEEKFDKAINILRETENLEETNNTETLGLLGAIYKNKWKFDNQYYNLKKSKHYYHRGYQIWLKKIEQNQPTSDDGYTGINAAYVLDLMASLQMNQILEIGAHDDVQQNLEKLDHAREIREKIISILSQKIQTQPEKANYWIYTTLVEACLGINDFENAKKYWNSALAKQPDSWQLESTKTQLIQLGQMLLTIETQKSILENRLNNFNPNLSSKVKPAGNKDFSKNLYAFFESALGS